MKDRRVQTVVINALRKRALTMRESIYSASAERAAILPPDYTEFRLMLADQFNALADEIEHQLR